MEIDYSLCLQHKIRVYHEGKKYGVIITSFEPGMLDENLTQMVAEKIAGNPLYLVGEMQPYLHASLDTLEIDW